MSAALLLQGCAGAKLPSLASATDFLTTGTAAKGIAIDATPVDTYTRIANSANHCWFKDGTPLTTGYSFHASTAADRSEAVIAIHETEQNGTRGLKAFVVKMSELPANRTDLVTENFRLQPELGALLSSDIERWAKGEASCDGAVATDVAAAETTAAIPKPVVDGPAIPLPAKAPEPPVNTATSKGPLPSAEELNAKKSEKKPPNKAVAANKVKAVPPPAKKPQQAPALQTGQPIRVAPIFRGTSL